MRETSNVTSAKSSPGQPPFLHRDDAGNTTSAAQHGKQDPQAASAIEKQRKQAEQQAVETLDKDAIAAVEETAKAVDAIASNDPAEALRALERASGKIAILLARNPARGLIPVDVEVIVIDNAPRDLDSILDLAGAAAAAIDEMKFPDARLFLRSLMSEIRVRIFNLPLATYPEALKDAARLLDERKTEEARDLLLSALATLAAEDHVTPIPLLLARAAINQAQELAKNDKQAALEHLQVAKDELRRSKELGYAGKDPEYPALKETISQLEKQLKGNEDTTALFAKLKEKLSSFLKRQSGPERGPRRAAA